MNIAVLDVVSFQTCFGSASSAFEIIELAYIHCALKENFSVTLTKKGFYMCFTQGHNVNFRKISVRKTI